VAPLPALDLAGAQPGRAVHIHSGRKTDGQASPAPGSWGSEALPALARTCRRNGHRLAPMHGSWDIPWRTSNQFSGVLHALNGMHGFLPKILARSGFLRCSVQLRPSVLNRRPGQSSYAECRISSSFLQQRHILSSQPIPGNDQSLSHQTTQGAQSGDQAL